jgi:hypothetical protein
MLKVAGGGVSGALNYAGTWNASTNTPTLASGVGVKGDYYVVSVAGTTNLDGITDWQIGDWAVFNGTAWQKVDNSDAVTSVNGQTGTVVLGPNDVGATANTTYVLAGTGLSGGGQLNANVTVNLANTAVGAGTYGKTDSVGQFTVDAQGRITAASNVGIIIPVANVTGGVANTVYVLAGTGLSGGGALTGNVTLSIPASGVVAASYGTASNVSTVTIDAQGIVSNAVNTPIAIDANQITSGTLPVSRGGTGNTTLTGYLIGDGTNAVVGQVTIPVSNISGAVANTVYVLAGTGLTGGGALTGNVTLSLDNTGVTANTYGSASVIPIITVDAQGRITSASNATVSINVTQVANAVPFSRNVTVGTGLSGGGNLSADITLSVVANTTQQLVAVQNNGVAVGTRQGINFIPGTNVTLTTADDATAGRANVTISATGGVTITDDTTTNATRYLLLTNATSGQITTGNVSSTKLTYNPLTGQLSSSLLNADNGIVINKQTVATSVTIPSGYSAMSTGPVTVNSGVTVTVPSGSKWVVL